MKKVLVILVLFFQIAGAKVLSAKYEVSFGVFERLGTAETTLEIREDQSYTVRIEAKTEGIAQFLSNNRIEIYESHGMVVNGLLVPNKYVKIRQTDSKKTFKIYTFDHKNKIVWKENVDKFDWEKVQNDFYASEDLLSLFFNFKHFVGSGENYLFHAIGGDKKDGRIDVIFPKGKQLVEAKQKLRLEDGDFLKVIINEKIFSSARGELLINLDKEGLCEKAVLEDVLFFGDIVGKRIR